LLEEQVIDPAHNRDLGVGPGDEDHAVGLHALLLSEAQLALRLALLVDEHATEPETRGPTLAVAELDEAALPLEDLRGELAAVLARHRALDGLHDVRGDAAVVLELLGAVVDRDARALADVLVVGALVRVLEAPPAA